MTKGHSQIFIGILFAILAIILFVHAVSLPPIPGAVSREPIGPYAWPKVLLAGIFLLSVIVALTGLKDIKNEHASSEVHQDVLSFSHDLRLIGLMMVALGIYVFILRYTGFILTTWVWLGALIFLLGARRWITIIGTATGVTVVLYVLFIKLLFVPLPRGVMVFQSFSRLLGH